MSFNGPYTNKRAKQHRKPNAAFEEVKVFLPKSVMEKIRKKAEETNIKMSRLIALAIDNELDAIIPFTYHCPMPTAPYIECAFQMEAGRVLKYLKDNFDNGTGVESLVICRRDMGIESRETVMFAIRELLEVKMIEVFKPKGLTDKIYPKVRSTT